IAYCMWLATEIWHASVIVSRIIWQVTPNISPRMAYIRSMPKNDNGKVLYANSITLAPGTLCMGVDTQYVLVHALQEEGIIALEDGSMDAHARALSLLAK